MDGLINLHKPMGMTSARALDRVRAVVGRCKSGHAGTLDPCASGVLVICLGRATKLVEKIMNLPKTYHAVARLDVTNECFDLERPLLHVAVERIPSEETARRACSAFEGWIAQVPPTTSAVKINGVAAYKRAARGEAMALAPRTVRIDWLHVHRYEWPWIELELCGGRLRTGGCLTSLTRRRVGPFLESDARTLDSLRAAGAPADYVIPLEQALALLGSAADEASLQPLPP
jgi:tRNA pseudouridine55 synthase